MPLVDKHRNDGDKHLPLTSPRQYLLISLAAIIISVSSLWVAIAFWYQLPFGATGRIAGIGLFLLYAVGIVAMAVLWRPLPAAIVHLVVFGFVIVWWQAIEPRLDRDWAPDVSRTVTGSVDGDIATLNNVRNFEWQARDRFTERWDSRRYDLSTLSSLDIILSYWSLDAIAHTLVSFGFEDGTHVVFSVEIRRERTEAFSEVGGFFKQFELAFIAADETDIVKLRTNVRREDVYLYPIGIPAEARRALFLAYLNAANTLSETPAFYNTITTNCTTVVFDLARLIEPTIPTDWRIVLSGYLPEYFAKHDALAWPKPYGNLRQRAAISARAQAAPDGVYSDVIRGR